MGADLDLASRAAALAERASRERPTSWRPAKHPEHPRLLVGKVVEKEELARGYGDDGDTVDTVVLETEECTWRVWAYHAVLDRELLRVRLGDLVAIKYEGRVPPRDGRASYEAYRVIVDRDGTRELSPMGDTPPSSDPPPACEACGFEEPNHAAGCPQEIPY